MGNDTFCGEVDKSRSHGSEGLGSNPVQSDFNSFSITSRGTQCPKLTIIVNSEKN